MTWTVAQARDRSRVAPVMLAEIQTLASGPLLRLADRNVSISGVQYADYLASVQGVGDTLDRATAVFNNANLTLTIKNDPWDAFDYLTDLSETYPLEGAAVTIKRVYLDDDGTPTTPETMWVGNLDSPTGITTVGFQCAANCRETFASYTNR